MLSFRLQGIFLRFIGNWRNADRAFCPAQQVAECTSLDRFLLAAGEDGQAWGWGEVEAWSQPWSGWGWEHSQEEWEEWGGGILHGHLPAQSKGDSGVAGIRAWEGDHREGLQTPGSQIPAGWFQISPPRYDLIIVANICSLCPQTRTGYATWKNKPQKRSQHFQNFSRFIK